MAPSFRIVSLCPSNTELVCALGLGEYLVGVDNYSDYPASVVENLPRLGPDLHIDVERVKALSPDLVLASLSVPGMEKVVSDIEHSGLNYTVLNAESVDEILEELKKVAYCVPEPLWKVDVTALIRQYRRQIESIRDWSKTVRDKPKLYFEWWPNPIFSPAQKNWLTELSDLAGAVNIFADSEGSQVKDSGALVCEKNPDVMFAVWTGIAQNKVPLTKIKSRDAMWQQTSAFRNHQIYILSEGLFCRPSLRLFDGLAQLIGLLHPDASEQLSLGSPASYGPIRRINGEWMSA